MIGYLRRLEERIYHNPATGDHWLVIEEEYETSRETVACYLTVRYLVPPAFEGPVVLKEVVGVDLTAKGHKEPATKVQLEVFDLLSEVPDSRLTFKLGGETSLAHTRDLWIRLHQEAMQFIHSRDVIGQIPPALRHLAEQDSEAEPFVEGLEEDG